MADKITTISPITNEPVVARDAATDADLQAILKKSQAAFATYSKTPLAQRQAIVSKALQLLRERADALAKELTEHMGRPIAYTAKEITTAAVRGEYMLKISSAALADTPGEPEPGFTRYIRKVPLGPVLVLFAWNYPWLILVNSLIPALLAGDTVILKPSPQTPTVAEHAARLFVDAGLPADVIQYFHCADFDRIASVIQSPQIRLVCFTGSVAGGLAAQRAAAESPSAVDVRVGLELGGKDPAYVRADVDVSWAADEIVDGAIFNSGQSCCSIERVYVHTDAYDAFVAAAQKVLAAYRLGDPRDAATQIGPVVSKRAKETIAAHVADALAKGAKDATPQNASFASPPAAGNYVAPTLLVDVDHSMQVMTDETFGPVVAVMRVTDDAEAVRLMNDSQFGLTASIWTKDTAAGHALAEGVDAGTVFVNRADYPAPDLAWTGWKNSGKGHTLSVFGFDQFVRLKNFHVKAYPM